MSLFRTLDIGTTGLVAQAVRLNAVASNVANAESVAGPDGQPYRARQVVFQASRIAGAAGLGVSVSRIVESDAEPRLEFRPDHPFANEDGYVVMPNVNPVEQMVDMISASRGYQMNLEIMNVSKQLMLKTLDLAK
jgi:flagellar basal-body rod protein FlgC